MDISEATVVNLLQGQARTEQAVIDLIGRFDKVVPALVQNDKDLDKKIHKVEKKIWYFGGAGTALGWLLTYTGIHFKVFGGK